MRSRRFAFAFAITFAATFSFTSPIAPDKPVAENITHMPLQLPPDARSQRQTGANVAAKPTTQRWYLYIPLNAEMRFVPAYGWYRTPKRFA